MVPFRLTILGSSSAIPTSGRGSSAQLLRYDKQYFLIDCGEGTQLILRKYHIHFLKISRIFISHLHGDHYFGLIGLITTMHLLGRKKDFWVYGPPELEPIIRMQLEASLTQLQYPLHIIPLQPHAPEVIYSGGGIEVSTVPLVHRIGTTGFIFRESPKERKINAEATQRYQVPYRLFDRIKAGGDVALADGTVVANAALTHDPDKCRAYAYCSDTAFSKGIADRVAGVDLLYHEATFEEKHKEHATEKFHSTASQAAQVACMAGASRLLIGHFSARYEHLDQLLAEARGVFAETSLAVEGLEIEV